MPAFKLEAIEGKAEAIENQTSQERSGIAAFIIAR